MTEAVGDRFQQETKYARGELPGGALDWANKPETYKRYLQSAQIALPRPRTEGGEGLWSVLSRRRSVRRYDRGPLRLEDLSQVLWAAQGITRQTNNLAFRTAPSAGAGAPPSFRAGRSPPARARRGRARPWGRSPPVPARGGRRW